jgi:type II secretory pathway component PulF
MTMQTATTTLENEKALQRRQLQLPLEEKIQIFDQLATELESGIPLVTALQTRVRTIDHFKDTAQDPLAFLLSGKPQGEEFIRELASLVADLGQPLHTAAQQFPAVFDPQFLAILNAAQQTGRYGLALRRQVDYLTEQKILKDHLKSVLRYPVFVFVVAIVVLAVALIKIVPGFTVLYEGLLGKAEFHWTTQLVLDISAFASTNWPVMMIGLAGSFLGYFWFRQTNPNVRRMEDQFWLRFPRLNRYIALIDTVNFLSTFILLREAGETMTNAFALAVEAMSNSELREAGQEAALNFERGTPQYIHLSLATMHPVFSEASSLYAQLKSYEEHASLAQLERYVKLLKHNANCVRDELASYVQPVSLVVVGIIVGFLVFSLYLPLFELIGKFASR